MYCDRRIYGIEKWYAVAPPDAEMLVPDTLRDCTCFLCVKRKDGSFSFGGTAYFVAYSQSQNSRDWHYLVTAKHCVEEAFKVSGNLYARLNTRDGKSIYTQLPKSGWYGASAESGSDVAVLPWDPPEAENLDVDSIGLQASAHPNNLEANAIGIGNGVLAVGMLSMHSGKSRNIPIIRHGILSAVPEEPLRDAADRPYNAFLVEIQSIGGLSGSPVFVHVPSKQMMARFVDPKERDRIREQNPAGYLYLLGTIQGHFTVPKDTWLPKDTEVHAGIAIVTPIQEVIDIVANNSELRERRQKDIRADSTKMAESVVLDSAFESEPFTKEDFEDALKRVSRKTQPSQSDEGKSKT